MVLLTCNCLNLKIHVKTSGTELTEIDAATLGVNIKEDNNDDFFRNKICHVHLDLKGVTKEHDCLVGEKTVGNWTISKCLNCRMKTHAIHRDHGNNTVLVSAKLNNETTVLKSGMASPDYSPLYSVVIPGRNDDQPTQSYGTSSLGRFEAKQQESLVQIQQRLNTYLLSEETAMEERIRHYEEQQRAAFSELRYEAKRDNAKLTSAALSVDEEEMKACALSEATMYSPLSPLSPGFQETCSSSASSSSDRKNSKLSQGKPEEKPTVLNLTRRPDFLAAAAAAAPATKSPDTEGLFDMDEFDVGLPEQDAGLYYESDEEDNNNNDNDTDDSSYSSDASMRESLRNTGYQRPDLYSRSAPINVPMWQSRIRKPQPDSPDESCAPDDIGASIQALAKSLCMDGTEIFGELPRSSNKQFKTVEIMKRREECHFDDESTNKK